MKVLVIILNAVLLVGSFILFMRAGPIAARAESKLSMIPESRVQTMVDKRDVAGIMADFKRVIDAENTVLESLMTSIFMLRCVAGCVIGISCLNLGWMACRKRPCSEEGTSNHA